MQFHEYLVNYRLTPRSRILRKHMPKLEAIMEQESAMESSSILHSQGHIVKSDYSRNTKFRYAPKDPDDLERAIESNSSSDEEIDPDLEKDIMAQINRQFLTKS